MTAAIPPTDLIRPFRIEALDLRGRLVRLGPAVDSILGAHGYPDAVARMLAEAVALAASLAGALRLDGSLKLQTQSDGPIAVMVVDAGSDGALRGYARFDPAAVAAAATADSAPVPRLLGVGRLAVTIDHGPAARRFQGVTALSGATLAECAETYFRQSEPIDAVIVAVAEGGAPARAAALMIERPTGDAAAGAGEDAEDAWRTAVALTGSVTAAELLDPGLPPDDLLFRLYHEHGVRLYPARPLRAACGCSREKVAAMLTGFSRDDRAAMVEDRRVVATCEFCKTDYVYTELDLEGMDTP